MSSQNGLKPNMTDAEHQKWLEGWSEFMVKMWRERMMQFAPPVYDTGALSRSVQGVIHPGPVTSIEHRFWSMASMWHVVSATATAITTVAT